ncbi:MAG: helix-turn-helix transcriptional regulator [Lentisphaerae bacterium]|nr:helix-turn-helix transcriptional regulator [Lentisphaerota bacterium]
MCNAERLKAVCEAFGIRPGEVARAAGVSAAYVSRVLSPDDPLEGSACFWIRLEAALGRLVEGRHKRVFDVPAAQLDGLANAVEPPAQASPSRCAA